MVFLLLIFYCILIYNDLPLTGGSYATAPTAEQVYPTNGAGPLLIPGVICRATNLSVSATSSTDGTIASAFFNLGKKNEEPLILPNIKCTVVRRAIPRF